MYLFSWGHFSRGTQRLLGWAELKLSSSQATFFYKPRSFSVRLLAWLISPLSVLSVVKSCASGSCLLNAVSSELCCLAPEQAKSKHSTLWLKGHLSWGGNPASFPKSINRGGLLSHSAAHCHGNAPSDLGADPNPVCTLPSLQLLLGFCDSLFSQERGDLWLRVYSHLIHLLCCESHEVFLMNLQFSHRSFLFILHKCIEPLRHYLRYAGHNIGQLQDANNHQLACCKHQNHSHVDSE